VNLHQERGAPRGISANRGQNSVPRWSPTRADAAGDSIGQRFRSLTQRSSNLVESHHDNSLTRAQQGRGRSQTGKNGKESPTRLRFLIPFSCQERGVTHNVFYYSNKRQGITSGPPRNFLGWSDLLMVPRIQRLRTQPPEQSRRMVRSQQLA
jgi:hypothetical protein